MVWGWKDYCEAANRQLSDESVHELVDNNTTKELLYLIDKSLRLIQQENKKTVKKSI